MKAQHTNNFARITKIMAWLKKRHARQTVNAEQLAKHYLVKAGWPCVPDGYAFHCVHNWSLGGWGGFFAVKALEIWNRRFEGQDDRERRIYLLACRRYAHK